MHLVSPERNETKDAATKKVMHDLEEHDELNRQLKSSYSAFDRGEGTGSKLRTWDDIPQPPKDASTGKIVFMFLVVDKLKNDAYWRDWFAKADADGFEDHYSIVYHRGRALGQTRDEVADDILARKGLAVWPPTKTGWARNGLVRATLLLLRFSLEHARNQWFVLLSDTCMPLWSFGDLYRKMSRQEVSSFHDFGQTLDRCMLRNMWGKGVPLVHKDHGRKADQWAMWVRRDAEWFVRENHLLKLKPLTVFADEPYFINLMDAFERPYNNRGTTYTRWYYLGDLPVCTFRNTCNAFLSSPHAFDKVDMKLVKNARSRGYWFMRKVAAGAPYPSVEELETGLERQLSRVPSLTEYHRDFHHSCCRMQ